MIAFVSACKRIAVPLALVAMFCAGSADAGTFDFLFGHSDAQPAWQKTATGVIVTPSASPAKKVRLEVMSERIMRVTAVPTDNLATPKSLMVTAKPVDNVAFTVTADAATLSLKTSKLTADVSLATGAVSFRDASGKLVLSGQDGGQFVPVKVEGKDFYAIRQEFNRGTDEGFYGLGQHQNSTVNYNGQDVTLAQHNMDIAMPFVMSSRNYGLLWDNYSVTHFGYPGNYPAMADELTLYDANGNKGGLTGSYYDGQKLVLTKVEGDPNYQYVADQKNWPVEMKDVRDNNRRVVWEGKIETAKTGLHKFRFYTSGYFKLWLDGKLVMDSWRQNWQGWYRNLDLQMQAGVPVNFRAEWIPQGGYLRFFHIDPLPDAERHELSLHSAVANAIDYYFIAGANMDELIAGYRDLTGQALMMPAWAYGYWQSRDRYLTQDEIVDTVKKYRAMKLPLDQVVQDWRYWKDPEWGSHVFDEARYPNPGEMVKQVHDLHAHIMISVWPKFYPTTDNYKELDAVGGVYHGNIDAGVKDWVGPGYLSTYYDPYNSKAGDIYWRQIADKIDSLGFDAYWLDNDEPDIHSDIDNAEFEHIMGPNAMGPGGEYHNTYPLVHVCGFYDHWHAAHPDTRVFLFTRSGFGGIQRCDAAVWSGDLAGRWSDLHDQIAAGVDLSMSGLPNWSFDIGGYVTEDRYSNPSKADLAEWRELFTRWYEFGAFVPLFRAHGHYSGSGGAPEGQPRELYNVSPPGTPVFNALAWYDRLRYRLMPYIYTEAGDMYHRAGTLMRGLVMDFPNDPNVASLNDEYMFGPSFLVAPVTEYTARKRDVYLPADTRWYDFYTDTSYEGGAKITADAPLAHMPLFVKAGSIVPVGPAVQYTNEKPGAPITLYVYTGQDGKFTLYEDDGVSFGYTRGESSRIPITYDDASATLTIGDRAGSFPGMVATRSFNVRWISGPRKDAVNFDAAPDDRVTYSGTAVMLKRGAPAAASHAPKHAAAHKHRHKYKHH
jgi:alpha-D-xyloside xylohydrolase